MPLNIAKYKGKKKICVKNTFGNWDEMEVDWADLLMINDLLTKEWYFSDTELVSINNHCAPVFHEFVQKALFQFPNWECKRCGLNLAYDKHLEAYVKFEKFRKQNPQINYPWGKGDHD